MMSHYTAYNAVYSKVAKVWGNFVEDEYYQKATKLGQSSVIHYIIHTCTMYINTLI